MEQYFTVASCLPFTLGQLTLAADIRSYIFFILLLSTEMGSKTTQPLVYNPRLFPLPSLYRMPPQCLRQNHSTPEVKKEPCPVKRRRKGKNQAPHIASSQRTEQESTTLQEIIAKLPALISNAVKEGIEAASAVALVEAIQPDQSDSAAFPSNMANNATPSSSIFCTINSVDEEITSEQGPKDKPTSKFTSASVPLASCVLERIKAKIWADELTDVAQLLSADTESQQYNFKDK